MSESTDGRWEPRGPWLLALGVALVGVLAVVASLLRWALRRARGATSDGSQQ